MTWHIGSTRAVLLACALSLFTVAVASGCGDDEEGGSDAPLRIVEPAADAEISRDDDTREEVLGVQFNVVAEADLDLDTEVQLVIAGEVIGTEKVDDEGLVTFADVTLPPGVKKIYARTPDEETTSDQDQQYTLRALVIREPAPGEQTDDDPTEDGFQLAVTVEAFEVDDDITLVVGDTPVATKEQENNEASFLIDLEPGDHILEAVAGDIRSEPVDVTAGEPGGQQTDECMFIDLVTPNVGDAKELMLGGEDSCPEDGDFKTDFVFATDAGDGLSATLMVNGNMAATVDVEGTVARFEGVTLGRRDTANRISVRVADDEGTACSQDFDLDILVDCDGPSCEINPPVTHQVQSGSDVTVFLNSNSGDGTEFDIGVATSEGAVGQKVELIIDGNTLSAPTATVAEDDGEGSATFSDVELAEGEHTVRARCVDESGNTTLSQNHVWTVDVTPCTVEVDSPAADFIFGPGDDDDSTTDGAQVLVEVTVGGDDCSQGRAAVCDPDDGITSAFGAYSGAPFSVTLDDTDRTQELCVEIADRAGNLASTEVAVGFIAAAPTVSFTSPADGTYYNAQGNDGDSQEYEADEDDTTTVCEATFEVACSEVGADVVLVRDPGGLADELATVECQDEGVAVFDQVAFLDGVAAVQTTLVATQSLTTSNADLVGVTDTLTLHGDCQPPTVTDTQLNHTTEVETLYCPEIALPRDAGAYTLRVTTPDASVGRLTYTPIGASTPNAPIEVAATTAWVDFGEANQLAFGSGDGSATLELEIRDAFENVTTPDLCRVSVLLDPPELAELAVADPPGTKDITVAVANSAECTNAGDRQFQVPVLFSPDKTDATRELVYTVNGGPAQPVALAAVASPICVPVSEGDNMITGILSTISDQGVNLGSVNQTLNNVSISTLRLDAPANNATYTGADGGCSGVEAALEATADEIYPDGEPATITVEQDMNVVRTINGMVVGGKVEACVPLEDGSQTLRVTIPHTGATASVDVQASLMDPSSVVIDDVTVTLPPKDNPVATDNYRSTPPTLTWTLPMGTFFWDSYEIRCSDNELTEPDDETVWWDGAGAVSSQVFSVTPPTPMGLYDVLIGHRRHCVLRVCEAARGCSGLPQTSFEIYKPFRYQLIAPPNEVGLGMSGVGPDPSESPAHLGTNATPVGDVNGDGLEDILVAGSHLDAFTASSGTSDAFLYFGRDLAPSHSDTPSVDQPDIIFREAHPYNNYGLNLGNTLAGLGDINGDGRPDFAIGSAGHCDDCGAGGSKPSARAYGAVFVFFGRASDDPWDSGGGSNIFDLSTPCGADVCLYGDPAVVFHIFGAGLAGVGRFDSDALNDVAIGAPQAGAGEGELYVISGGSFVDLTVDNVADIGGCSASPCTRPGAVWGISRSLPADSADFTGYLLTGSVIDDGDGGTGSNDYSRMGALLTAVGDMDASQDGLMDLVTADTSSSTPKISLLAGREWSGLAGLQPLTVDDLSLIGTDRPNYVLAAVGNVYDPPGGNVGVPDLAFKDQASDTAIIYPGDVTLPEGFDDTKKITIQTFQTEGAESICGGEFPALGLVDFTDATPDRFLDIDEDGLADLCLGSARDDLAQPPGTAYLMYGSSIAGTAAGDNVALPLAVRITPPSAAADTELRTTQYVGDITGDGAPDLVVGDRPDRFDDDVVRDGALWILY